MDNETIPEKNQICQIPGCRKSAKTRGYCKSHYETLRRNGKFTTRRCKIERCCRPIYGIGLCRSHWRKLKAYGTPHVRNQQDKNHIEINGNTCIMDLYKKNAKIAETIFDVDDYNKVCNLKWTLSVGQTSKYVIHVKPQVLLHRFIFGYIPNGFEVDHINRDSLDNRKSNLRLVTRTLNNANSKSNGRANSTSGYKGVHWSSQKDKFIAIITKDGKAKFLGQSKDPIKLAKIYNDAAAQLFGEYANLNIIPE